jgi:hypothetical protein
VCGARALRCWVGFRAGGQAIARWRACSAADPPSSVARVLCFSQPPVRPSIEFYFILVSCRTHRNSVLDEVASVQVNADVGRRGGGLTAPPHLG